MNNLVDIIYLLFRQQQIFISKNQMAHIRILFVIFAVIYLGTNSVQTKSKLKTENVHFYHRLEFTLFFLI